MGYEGAEKRLEIGFSLSSEYPRGLRQLTRSQLDELMDLACCTIVSMSSTAEVDAYILSESSLFIICDKYILKTCGRTTLLRSIKKLLQFTKEWGMKPITVKYSRSSFLFPEKQHYPYGDFSSEVSELENQIENVGFPEGRSYILGNYQHGLQWHIYYTTLTNQKHGYPSLASNKTIEICITGLDSCLMEQFVKTKSFINARTITINSKIGDLLPDCLLDDHMFDPCGYSMNGISDLGILTVHVTPEADCSFASIEFSCLKETKHKSINLYATLQKVWQIFNPQSIHVAVHTSAQQGQKKRTEVIPQTIPRFSGEGLTIQFLNDSTTQVLYKVFQAFHTQNDNQSRSSSDDALFTDLYPCEDCQSSSTEEMLYCSGRSLRNYDLKCDVKPVIQTDMELFIRHLICSENLQDTFYVANLSVIHKLYGYWRELFPRIEPFYAVKCNTDEVFLALLGELGANFDCAAEEEMKIVNSLGIDSSRIIYANACKHPSHLCTAHELGIRLTTFDTLMELQKMKKYHPNCQALLRIRSDDAEARCVLGNKYGAEMMDIPALLTEAKALGIDVIGVSFHVGSGATNPQAYSTAVRLGRTTFDLGLEMGFNMNVLDIGGGFCSGNLSADGLTEILPVRDALNNSIDLHFPPESGIRIIAEPGRYFAETGFTFLCQVIGKRERLNSQVGLIHKDYWITDGLYGSFNCIPYDHASPKPIPLSFRDQSDCSVGFNSTVFGPTCDGLDIVLENHTLPDLTLGDWLLFPNMGAYTLSGASDFNGIQASQAKVFYVWADFI